MMRFSGKAAAVFLALVFAAGCGVTTKEPAGEERGDCLPDGTCNEGLTCASGVCVRLDDAGGVDGGEPQDKGVSVRDAGTDAADGGQTADVAETPDGETPDAAGDPDVPDGGAAPKICPEPVAVDFGAVFVGQTKTQTVAFKSCGTAPVSLLSVELAAASGNWFSLGTVSAALPATLDPGNEVRVTATCAPAGVGTQQGQLDVHTDDPSLPQGKGFIRLVCQAVEQPGCRIKADPFALDFGKLAPNVVSYKEFQLFNVGETACDVSEILGPANPEFEIAGIRDDKGTALAGAPFAIDPARRVNVSVRFTAPATKTCLSDGITFVNSSENAPNLNVTLAGCGGEAPLCTFKVQPLGTLDFGNVAKGSKKTMSVNLENVGTDACEITQARLGTQTGNWYSLAKAYSFPIQVQPGSTAEIDVNCAPAGTGPAPNAQGIPDIYGWNVLHTSTTDPAQPQNGGSSSCTSAGWCHKLLCTGTLSRLDVLPTPVDFGLTTLGCNSQEIVVRLYNNGTAPLNVTQLEITPSANPPVFIISSAPPTPFSIGAMSSVAIKLKYRPTRNGAETGTLRIHSDAPNAQNGVVDVVLKGEGTQSSAAKDNFVQTDKPMVDVLWCVYNSGSMGEEQMGVSLNSREFIEFAVSLNIDYQIGVVTSEINEAEQLQTGMNYPGILFQRPGYPRIITNSVPHPTTPPYQPTNVDPIDAFEHNAMPGECCSDEQEACMEAVRMALSEPLIGDENANRGFLRKYAKLVVIMMSDEEDQSPGGVDYYVEFLKALKGAKNKDLLSVSIIAGTDGLNPPTAQACDTADAGVRYVDLFKKIGNGLALSICTSDWGKAMQSLGLDTFVSVVEYYLSRQADPSTIVVKVNGAVVQNDPVNGYSFDPNTNSIVFGSGAIPPKGAAIEVTYSAQCY
jgi:hypothetical protein